MKARSLSVSGRSAEVMNRTRSARGTYSSVIASCSRSRALVPGVSTIVTWRSSRSGRDLLDAALENLPGFSSPNARRWIRVVVGVTPSGSRALPRHGVDEGALAGVELADDDQQKELVQLTNGLLQGRQILRPASQRAGGLQLLQSRALAGQNSF